MSYPFAPAVTAALVAGMSAEADPPDNGLLKSTTAADLESLRAKFREQLKPWPDNYPPFDSHRRRMQTYIEHHAALLVREAESLGFVLSITQRHVNPAPAIGRTINEITVTPKRIQS